MIVIENINIGKITIDTSKSDNKEKEIEEVVCQLIKHVKILFDNVYKIDEKVSKVDEKVSKVDEKVEILTSDK